MAHPPSRPDTYGVRSQLSDEEHLSVGLAAFTGALAGEWDTVDEDMTEIVAARAQVSDRPAPELP